MEKWLQQKKLEAEKIFEKTPMPTTKDEEWRYTSLEGVNLDNLAFQKTILKLSPCRKIVLTDINTAMTKYHDLIKKHLGVLINEKEGKFQALVSSHWKNGYFLYVPSNVSRFNPLTIDTITDSDSATRNIIILEKNTSVNLYEQSLVEKGLNINATEIFLGENSTLNFYFFQNCFDAFTLSYKKAACKENANINWHLGLFGGNLTKTKIETVLEKDGSQTRTHGIFYSKGKGHIDIATNVYHLSPNTTNDILIKGVLDQKATSVYHGLIYIDKIAQRANSYLAEHVLHLSDDCLTNSIPSLKIEANNVRATHGSTIGQIDKEQLFYLMSRGLERKKAEELIVKGFFQPMLNSFKNDIKSGFEKTLEERIGNAKR